MSWSKEVYTWTFLSVLVKSYQEVLLVFFVGVVKDFAYIVYYIFIYNTQYFALVCQSMFGLDSVSYGCTLHCSERLVWWHYSPFSFAFPWFTHKGVIKAKGIFQKCLMGQNSVAAQIFIYPIASAHQATRGWSIVHPHHFIF